MEAEISSSQTDAESWGHQWSLVRYELPWWPTLARGRYSVNVYSFINECVWGGGGRQQALTEHLLYARHLIRFILDSGHNNFTRWVLTPLKWVRLRIREVKSPAQVGHRQVVTLGFHYRGSLILKPHSIHGISLLLQSVKFKCYHNLSNNVTEQVYKAQLLKEAPRKWGELYSPWQRSGTIYFVWVNVLVLLEGGHIILLIMGQAKIHSFSHASSYWIPAKHRMLC